MLLVDCDCPTGLDRECEACKQEELERGIECAMLRAEEEEGS